MADVRESFPSLEGASGEGLVLRSVQEGEAVASKNGQLAFAFKDNSGNAIAAPVKQAGQAVGDGVAVLAAKNTAGNAAEIPTLAEGEAVGQMVAVSAYKDASGDAAVPQLIGGAVPVTFDVGTDLYARGKVAGNLSQVTVATITLTASKTYQGIEAVLSCFRDAVFEIIFNDDGSETILADAVCSPGNTTANINLSKLQFTAGAAGTQQLLVKAINLNSTSDFRATVATTEQP